MPTPPFHGAPHPPIPPSPHPRARLITAEEGCNIVKGIDLTCTGPGEEGTGDNHHLGLGYLILIGIGAVVVVCEPWRFTRARSLALSLSLPARFS